jgi:hypothetical protein
MANLIYRTSSTPTTPVSTVVKNAPLTNLEVDGNFKSIDNGLSDKLTLSGGAETVNGIKTFSAVVVLGSQASQVTHAVRADRDVATGNGLTGGGNLTSNRTISLLSISAGSTLVGAIAYNGTTRDTGKFYGGTTDPTGTTRLNYDGLLRVTRAQTDSIGVGTSAPPTTGEIRATGDVVSAFSDDRLKDRLGVIEGALDKVCSLTGFYYKPNVTAQSLGYKAVRSVGVSAQEVQAVMPEVVVPAPIDDKYLTVNYDKIVPLLIQAIKELREEVEQLKNDK